MENNKFQIAANFNWQGHRGCRGILPENSIPAFIKATAYNVKTMELDIAISKDKQVIVSHEPWFSSHICTKPNGKPVKEEEQMHLLIYNMTYEEIKQFDCGSRGNAKYPDQTPMKVHKPSLRDMVTAVDAHCHENNLSLPNYSIEVKSKPKGYGIHIPHPEEYVRIILDTIKNLGIKNRINLQSFDLNILKEIKKQDPEIVVALLIDNPKSVKKNLKLLGYIPEIYSPYYKLLSKKKIDKLHKRGIKVIPWTVNSTKAMKRLIKAGVDGIITDYPNRIAEIEAYFK